MTIDGAICLLYENEINCGVSSFWDSGISAWIGDASNGQKETHYFEVEHIGDVGPWLLEAARWHYPHHAAALSPEAVKEKGDA
jgi:hypothetical protein